ncbi:HDOD domain-containing protein [Brassicibacter mesophilus]|uniref:HDOD domain-containing protein n=1 Tax=Brassicibacter mesophilus TaxID=745119 RepID=UPI003D22C702
MSIILLNSIMNRINDMPMLPESIETIIRLTEDPDSTVKDLEKEILKDQSLTSQVLKLANSTHYGYSRRISTISEATVLLGFQTIKSIALTTSVNTHLLKELPGYGLKKDMLWQQSLACAIISRLISKKTKICHPEQAYIAGLLRDIGKVILNCYVTSEFYKIIDKVNDEGSTFIEAEEEILGYNHAQVGANIARKWNFPANLVEAIEYHHSPEAAMIDHELVSIVHIADALAMMLGIGLGIDGMQYMLSDFALESISLCKNDIEHIVSEVTDMLFVEEALSITE